MQQLIYYEMMIKQTDSPLISIILPVYNGRAHLAESIDSVLRQEYKNFELIIVNDGSSDDSQDIIDHYMAIDSRIHCIEQENKGLVATLNETVAAANGDYVARIDSDDPWMDSKLTDQMNVMLQDQEIVLVGGGFEIIDEQGFFIETIHVPTFDEDIRRTLYLRNPFGHSSVLFKRQAAIDAGLYSKDVGPTEDYDLWARLSKQGKLAAVPHPVFRYRISLDGISATNSEKQAYHTRKIVDLLWTRDGHPQQVSRHELVSRSSDYLKASIRMSYGVGLKEQYLSDAAQTGVKMIRFRHFSAGLRQLVNVASTGRTGLRLVLKRLRQIDRGSIKQASSR